MRVQDITLPLTTRIPVWPGDPPVTVTPLSTLPNDVAAVSHLGMSSHAGTHVDPPAHFIAGGATVDQLALDILIGPAWLAHLPGPGPISAASLSQAGIPQGTVRLLLRTSNSDRQGDGAGFDEGYVALAEDAARWLLTAGVRLVGTDGPSIEPFVAPGHPVHHLLLGAGVVIVENLALAGVVPGAYQFCCLPLAIAGGDGAPARAVLISES